MKITLLGTGTSQGIPVIACDCEVCHSVDARDKRLRSSVMIETDQDLRSVASEIAVDMGVDLYEGIIATGDQFVASSERKAWIEKTFNADALEMEGASVACVCHNFGVPFFVLRAISDSADGSADVDFDAFLQSSAQVSAKFILEMVKRIGD